MKTFLAYWCLVLPALIGVLALAALWPLFEAGSRLQRGERFLFGPIPSMEQRVEYDLRSLVDRETAAAGAGRIVAYFTHLVKEEQQGTRRTSADDTRSPEERAEEEAEKIQQAVEEHLADFREMFAVFLQRYEFERSQLLQDADERDEEDQRTGNIVSHMSSLISNLTQAPEDAHELSQALIQQLELATAPDEEAGQDEEDMDVLSVTDQAFASVSQQWSIGRVASYLMLAAFCAVLSLFWSLQAVCVRSCRDRLIHRSYLAAYGVCIITIIAGLGIIPLIARAHFGEGNEGWAVVLLSDLLAYGWPLLVILLLLIVSHVHALRADTLAILGMPDSAPAAGDRFLEHLRTGGEDPDYSSATRRSILLHLFVIIGPILLSFFPGCWGSDSYRLPSGSGEPAAAVMVQVVEEEQEKEELILAEDSPIIFERATIDDSDAMQQLVEQSKQTYEASGSGTAGRTGIGEGRDGGFLGRGGPIRFIRIRHRARGWDDGMTADTGNADANFLRSLGRAFGTETESRGEAMTIEQIYHRFPRGERPPFVYLTGRSLRFSNTERELLRRLCLEGTLLFADAETRDFHRDFTREMRQVFPDRQLIYISDEDPIMQIPNVFPRGLQSNQWHGPQRAFGIRHRRQLVVFYHPGDANDMWKDDARLVDREIRDTAFWIGQNIVYYAFRRYHERYGGGRR